MESSSDVVCKPLRTAQLFHEAIAVNEKVTAVWSSRPVLCVDELAPRKSNFHPTTMSATVHPDQGPSPGDIEATRPHLPPYKAPPLPGLPASWPLRAQKGHSQRRWEGRQQERSGEPWLSLLLCENFGRSGCHPQHLRGQPQAGNGETKAAGRP